MSAKSHPAHNVASDNRQQQSVRPGFTKYPNAMFGRFLPSEAHVWLALRSHSWKKNGAHPALGTIVAMTGLSETTVKRAIRKLVAEGELTVTPRGKVNTNSYTFPNAEQGSFTGFENAWWSLRLTSSQTMVLLAIKNYSTLERGAVPGCRKLATKTKVGKDTILENVIPALERIGVLEVDTLNRNWGGRRLSNKYSIRAFDDIVSRDLYVPETTSYVPETTPVCVPETTPLVPETTPVCVPEVTPEEDSSRKTDQGKTDLQEDEVKKTHYLPPRLRRAVDETPSGQPDVLGQEGAGTPTTLPTTGHRLSDQRYGIRAMERTVALVESTPAPEGASLILDSLEPQCLSARTSHLDFEYPGTFFVGRPRPELVDADDDAPDLEESQVPEIRHPDPLKSLKVPAGLWSQEPWSVRRSQIISKRVRDAAGATGTDTARSFTEQIEALLKVSRTQVA